MILLVIKGKRNSVEHQISGAIHHMVVIYGTHVWNDISRHFYHFFFWFFGLWGRYKGKKWPKMIKKFCLSYSISQEAYILWSGVLVHMCKMVKWWHRVIFWFLQNFDFPGCERGKRVQNGPKWQKILSVSLCISGTVHQMIVIFGTHE